MGIKWVLHITITSLMMLIYSTELFVCLGVDFKRRTNKCPTPRYVYIDPKIITLSCWYGAVPRRYESILYGKGWIHAPQRVRLNPLKRMVTYSYRVLIWLCILRINLNFGSLAGNMCTLWDINFVKIPFFLQLRTHYV